VDNLSGDEKRIANRSLKKMVLEN